VSTRAHTLLQEMERHVDWSLFHRSTPTPWLTNGRKITFAPAPVPLAEQQIPEKGEN
jgi:hypothetical protein